MAYLDVSGGSLLPDFLTDSLREMPEALIVLLFTRLPGRIGRCASPSFGVILEIKRVATFPAGPSSSTAAWCSGKGRVVGGRLWDNGGLYLG